VAVGGKGDGSEQNPRWPQKTRCPRPGGKKKPNLPSTELLNKLLPGTEKWDKAQESSPRGREKSILLQWKKKGPQRGVRVLVPSVCDQEKPETAQRGNSLIPLRGTKELLESVPRKEGRFCPGDRRGKL